MKKIMIAMIMAVLVLGGCYIEDSEREYTAWPDGIVPYYYASGFTESEKRVIENVMFEIESIADIQFIEKDKYNQNYYIIEKDDGNRSTIGFKNNGENHLYLKNIYEYILIHELFHGLGLIHEHQREDRDDYVEINWDNIFPEKWDNFDKVSYKLIPINNFPYDYISIMHYGNRLYSYNNGRTIIALDNYYFNLIGRTYISEGDKQKLKYIYE